MLILLLSMLFSFDCSASSLPDDSVIQETSIEELTEEITTEESTENVNEIIVDDSDVLKNYDVKKLVSFSYIRDLPESVSMADFYILVCRIYNLILMAVWILIAFDVIELVARSIGRLKRKN